MKIQIQVVLVLAGNIEMNCIKKQRCNPCQSFSAESRDYVVCSLLSPHCLAHSRCLTQWTVTSTAARESGVSLTISGSLLVISAVQGRRRGWLLPIMILTILFLYYRVIIFRYVIIIIIIKLTCIC